MAGKLRSLVFDRQGKLRSGFAVVLFAIAAVGSVILLSQLLAVARLLRPIRAPPSIADPQMGLQALLVLASSLTATWVASHAVGRRMADAGFTDARPARHLGMGFGIGGILLVLIVGLPWAAGALGLSGPGPVGARAVCAAGVAQLLILAPQSAAEEILLRGFPLRQLSDGIGRAGAVAVTGCLFGVLHLKNPDASAVAALNIALTGLFLGVLVLRTGSLWLTIGLHIAWNWFEGFVWGQPVSGLLPGLSLLHRTWARSPEWTGGAFGPEASLVTTAVIGGALALALFVGFRYDRVQEPGTDVS